MQAMDRRSLGRKFLTLAHSKLLLFIDDDQGQSLKLDGVRHHGVGSHDNIDLATGNFLFHIRRGSGDHQRNLQSGSTEQFFEGSQVLLRERHRRCNKGRLLAVSDGSKNRPQRHSGFSTADVPLNQSRHRESRLQILVNHSDHPILGPGKFKGEAGRYPLSD